MRSRDSEKRCLVRRSRCRKQQLRCRCSWGSFLTALFLAVFMTANPGMVRQGVAGTIGVLSKPTDERAVQTAVDYALRRRTGQPVQYAPPQLQLFG